MKIPYCLSFLIKKGSSIFLFSGQDATSETSDDQGSPTLGPKASHRDLECHPLFTFIHSCTCTKLQRARCQNSGVRQSCTLLPTICSSSLIHVVVQEVDLMQ